MYEEINMINLQMYQEISNSSAKYLILLNYKRTAISWHLRKQVGVIAYPMYSASVAFLRVRRINIEIKIKKNKK